MDAVARFAELVDRPADEVELGRAALAFAAAAADSTLDEGMWLAELDRLAAGVQDFDGLRERLFGEHGFTGAVHDYDEPDNSLLHHVLARRRGIPISLSVVMIEAGRRAGVAVEGVGAPGHFLVADPASGRLCDPFHGGAVLEGGGLPLLEDLPIVDAHQILTRMLNNLVRSYRQAGRIEALHRVLRCQQEIPGVRVHAALQLGESLAGQGRFGVAAGELEAAAERLAGEDRLRLERAALAARSRLN